MMNSRRICPADGSQYIDSAFGLVVMESAVELAMETSKVKSVVRNQAEAKLNHLEHDEPAETMNQLQVLKSKDEPAVAIISTVDESINSRYPRSKKLRRIARLELERRRKSAGALSGDDISSDIIIQQEDTRKRRRVEISACGLVVDDVIGDVIIFSRWFERPVARFSSHTVEAVVHLWSLGVLTAAGCGIGSVHAVVRSNLLVEPSEVEEGEISVSGALVIVFVQEQRAIAAPVCISSVQNLSTSFNKARLLIFLILIPSDQQVVSEQVCS
ncbi:hypothetical protein F511_29011 [Dorcoceras hygrometricum]|uniref:Uncharacterized protein n=1 Tax=Dorcoceras hygrometricum TaxID=472368 RepID=A0A2Z7AP11_9LAMI|nr:hypothetical protein F511_29011 [Dorcoceras hygrometricum]